MEPLLDMQLFTFLMTITCFLPDYRKKKTRTSFFLVLFYVFDDAVASRVVLTSARASLGRNDKKRGLVGMTRVRACLSF